MSIDYSIFLHSDEPILERLQLLNGVEGVSIESANKMRIDGLMDVRCIEKDDRGRMIMQEDFGEYGLDVNWKIDGRRDNEWDILDLMDRLYRCAASLVNAFPEENCSLMRNSESFYVFNTKERLILSPIYLESLPHLPALFQKPAVVAECRYW